MLLADFGTGELVPRKLLVFAVSVHGQQLFHWRHLLVFFLQSQLVMTVDGIHSERWTTAGTFSMLSSSRLYVGGADPSSSLPGLRTRNDFIGCLRKVSVY